jgi:YesN/AraC family two-component response regulator
VENLSKKGVEEDVNLNIIEFDLFSPFLLDVAGILKKNKPWLHPTRNWDILVLAFMENGEMKLSEENTELAINKNTFFILQPNKKHAPLNYSNGNLQLPWIHLIYRHNPITLPIKKTMEGLTLRTSSDLPYNKETYGKIYVPQIWNVQNVDLIKLKFHETYHLLQSKNPLSLSKSIVAISEILLHISMEYSTSLSTDHNVTSQSYFVVNNVLAYINKHWSSNLTLAQLSQLFDITPTYLIRSFKNHLGTTPVQYMIHLKINKAKDLLLDSNLTIKQITAEVGMDNPYYLSRLFKKHTGMSPSEFRLHSY